MKNWIRCLWIVFVIIGGSTSLSFAADVIAVLDFKSILAGEEMGIAVAEILRTELAGLGDYTVIERGMLEQILEEQALQASGAIDSETAVEIGKLLGANLVVTGSIVKTGDVYTINSRFIDLETGMIKTGQNIRGEGENEISNMVHQLALVITGRTIVSEKTISTPTPQETAPAEPASAHGVPAGQPALQPSGPQPEVQPMPPARSQIEPKRHLLFSFEQSQEVSQWKPLATSQVKIRHSREYAVEGEHTLHVTFPKSRQLQGLATAQIPADWSAYTLLEFQIFLNPRASNQPARLWIMIDDDHSTRGRGFAKEFPLHPGPNAIRIRLDEMRPRINLTKITRLALITRNNAFGFEAFLDAVVLSAIPQALPPEGGQHPQQQPEPLPVERPAPPLEAVNACNGKQPGDSCQIPLQNTVIKGTCHIAPSRILACMSSGGLPPEAPPQERFDRQSRPRR